MNLNVKSVISCVTSVSVHQWCMTISSTGGYQTNLNSSAPLKTEVVGLVEHHDPKGYQQIIILLDSCRKNKPMTNHLGTQQAIRCSHVGFVSLLGGHLSTKTPNTDGEAARMINLSVGCTLAVVQMTTLAGDWKISEDRWENNPVYLCLEIL